VSEFLLRRFGIQFDPEVSYNERLKALTGALRGVRKKHLDFFSGILKKDQIHLVSVRGVLCNHLPGV
jgi:hypothetical protein